MKRQGLLLFFFIQLAFCSFSQQEDSIQKVTYQTALQHIKQGAFSQATVELTQLISSGFPNKEVYLERGIAFYAMNEWSKAKSDLDEAVKARINSPELFEYRGNTKYKLEDYHGAAIHLDKPIALDTK